VEVATGQVGPVSTFSAAAGTQDVVSWALDCDDMSEVLRSFQTSQSLGDLFHEAKTKGKISVVDSLSDLSPEELNVYQDPRPAGYTAQTLLSFGGKPVQTLLDYGAIACEIPEEVACLIISYVLEQTKLGKMSPSDRLYPITSLERYRAPTSMLGVGKGPAMETRYAVVLRAEFVPVNCVSGVGEHPIRDISFKVLPKGTANVPGCLLAFPVLDVEPYGMGHRTCEATHFFSELGV
jgi:hypothetical protein